MMVAVVTVVAVVVVVAPCAGHVIGTLLEGTIMSFKTGGP